MITPSAPKKRFLEKYKNTSEVEIQKEILYNQKKILYKNKRFKSKASYNVWGFIPTLLIAVVVFIGGYLIGIGN